MKVMHKYFSGFWKRGYQIYKKKTQPLIISTEERASNKLIKNFKQNKFIKNKFILHITTNKRNIQSEKTFGKNYYDQIKRQNYFVLVQIRREKAANYNQGKSHMDKFCLPLQPSKFTSAVDNCLGFCRGKQCFYSNHLDRNIAEVIIS